jgi:hydroxymethylpyrimidine pyrophosphatase-like HAD family hydrolase
MVNGRDRICWREHHAGEPVRSFLRARAADPRLMPLDGWSEVDPGQVFYITVIGDRDGLLAVRDQACAALGECFVTLGPDGYNPAQHWLEIYSRDATKAAAAARLQREIGAGPLIVFGDNLNDVPMFEIADQALAVANAVPELLAIATAVIGSNDDDGVAEWLARNILGRRQADSRP